jgi:hypothetical protein
VFIQNLGPVKRVKARAWRLDESFLFVFTRFENKLILEFQSYLIYYILIFSKTHFFNKLFKRRKKKIQIFHNYEALWFSNSVNPFQNICQNHNKYFDAFVFPVFELYSRVFKVNTPLDFFFHIFNRREEVERASGGKVICQKVGSCFGEIFEIVDFNFGYSSAKIFQAHATVDP